MASICFWALLLAYAGHAGLVAAAPSIRATGKPPACIIDIDKTITDPAFKRTTAKKVPMANAQAILQKLASRGIAIFYLSRRPIGRLDATKWWLAQHEFPPGAGLYLCDRDEDKVSFKVGIIQRLQKDYNVLFGVGDQPTDMESYGICGIAPLCINTASDWLAADRQIQEIVSAASAGKTSGPDLAKRLFASAGRNPYFILEPGFRTVLEGKGKKLTITVLDETREIAGIAARVVEEREEEGGMVTEISRNYYAISVDTHDVFSLGKDVDAYRDGKVVSHAGSCPTGDEPGRASLFLPGQLRRGMRCFGGESPGTVGGRAEILGRNETAATPAGVFTGCLKIRKKSDPTGERDAIHTFAPGIGLVQKGDLLLVRCDRPSGDR